MLRLRRLSTSTLLRQENPCFRKTKRTKAVTTLGVTNWNVDYEQTDARVYPSGQKVSSGSLFTGTHAHIYILRRLLLPEHYGVPLRLHVLNFSGIVYSNRDVTTNYCHYFISESLLA
jgi:hypothetical protein